MTTERHSEPEKESNQSHGPSTGGARYCVFRLDHVISLATLGMKSDEYLQGLVQRQRQFTACLMNNLNAELTYDLRYLCQPSPKDREQAVIQVCLIIRTMDMESDAFMTHVEGIYDVLVALFPEYEFTRLHKAEMLTHLIPFPIGYLANIRRRCGMERIDTQRDEPSPAPMGFERIRPPAAPRSKGEVYHVYPFLPTVGSMRAILAGIVAWNTPFIASIRLQPTRLTRREERFLEEQITTCEAYSQVSMGYMADDISRLRPTLREKAAALNGFNSRLLAGLRGGAVLQTFEIATPGPAPGPLMDLFSGGLTAPAGSNRGSGGAEALAYLAGGYEIDVARPGSARYEAFRQARIHVDSAPDVPDDAERLGTLFDIVEAGTNFRLPPAEMDDLPGMHLRRWRQAAPPRGLSEEGIVLGTVSSGRKRWPVRISKEDRRRHTYIVGQTGTGKTTALRSMILSDMEDGEGLCLIDPHGDLFADILGRIPEHRRDDVVLFDPCDTEWPVAMNFLSHDSESQAFFIAEEFCGIISRMISDEYGGGAVHNFAGPVFFQHLRMNLLLLMSDQARPGTLQDLHAIFNEENYWKQWLPLKSSDPLLKRWVGITLATMDYQAREKGSISMGEYLGSKLEGFVFEPRLRKIFGQTRSTINLRKIMDDGKILLVNLSKGLLTERNSRFLGMLLLSKLIATILGRADVLIGRRRPFTLYVDEFQSIATEGFVTLLSEARKFGINLVLANQFVSQIENPRILQAVFGNVGSLACFRVGHADSEMLEPHFAPDLTRRDLMGLPNWKGYLSTMVAGVKMPPFTFETIPEVQAFDDRVVVQVRESSRQRYAISNAQTAKGWKRLTG